MHSSSFTWHTWDRIKWYYNNFNTACVEWFCECAIWENRNAEHFQPWIAATGKAKHTLVLMFKGTTTLFIDLAIQT